ncbi:MAG: hypothetical protein R6V51_00440 [Dehalococcoidia bacterium]
MATISGETASPRRVGARKDEVGRVESGNDEGERVESGREEDESVESGGDEVGPTESGNDELASAGGPDDRGAMICFRLRNWSCARAFVGNRYNARLFLSSRSERRVAR